MHGLIIVFRMCIFLFDGGWQHRFFSFIYGYSVGERLAFNEDILGLMHALNIASFKLDSFGHLVIAHLIRFRCRLAHS